MANVLTKMRELLHKIRIKYYPADNLTGGEGKFFARTAPEAVAKIEDVCIAAINRGDYDGESSNMVNAVNRFLDMAMHMLLDAYPVNFEYFTIYPRITGLFDAVSVEQPYDRKKNPIKFGFRTRPKLQRLIDEVEVLVEGRADTTGGISWYLDTDENAMNEITVPGNLFVLEGDKIKIAGDDPGVGVYLKDAGNSGAEVKVTRIAYNSASKIIGITPNTAALQNRIVIRTQYNGSGSTFLKEPRTITSDFILDQI